MSVELSQTWVDPVQELKLLSSLATVRGKKPHPSLEEVDAFLEENPNRPLPMRLMIPLLNWYILEWSNEFEKEKPALAEKISVQMGTTSPAPCLELDLKTLEHTVFTQLGHLAPVGAAQNQLRIQALNMALGDRKMCSRGQNLSPIARFMACNLKSSACHIGSWLGLSKAVESAQGWTGLPHSRGAQCKSMLRQFAVSPGNVFVPWVKHLTKTRGFPYQYKSDAWLIREGEGGGSLFMSLAELQSARTEVSRLRKTAPTKHCPASRIINSRQENAALAFGRWYLGQANLVLDRRK